MGKGRSTSLYPFEGFAICKCFKLCISRVFASAVLPVNQLDRKEAAPRNAHRCKCLSLRMKEAVKLVLYRLDLKIALVERKEWV